MQSILVQFGRLTDFSGRQSRGTFWPFVGCAFALYMLGSLLAVAPVMTTTLVKMQRFAAEAQADPAGADMAELDGFPDIGLFMAISMAGFAVLVGLVAAAVARRLHDSGLRAWWGLAPLPFVIVGGIGFTVLVRQFNDPTAPDLTLFGLMFLNNMLYLVVLVGLVLLLSRAGTRGPNRFGPDPSGTAD